MTTQQQYSRKKKIEWFPALLLLSQFLSACLTVWLIWQSVEVYAMIGVNLASHSIITTLPKWLAWFISNTWILGWFVGWLVEGGVVLIYVASMLFLYAILQIFEVAPILLENDPRTLKRLIGAIASYTKLPINKDDHPTVAFLKDRHNAVPSQWVNSIYTAKWLSYTIDLIICLLACPPINGGWQRLGIVMTAPVFSDFDFVNAAKIAITMFAVECGVCVWLWIRRGRVLLASAPKDGGPDNV